MPEDTTDDAPGAGRPATRAGRAGAERLAHEATGHGAGHVAVQAGEQARQAGPPGAGADGGRAAARDDASGRG